MSENTDFGHPSQADLMLRYLARAGQGDPGSHGTLTRHPTSASYELVAITTAAHDIPRDVMRSDRCRHQFV
jgi:hypothetical protein